MSASGCSSPVRPDQVRTEALLEQRGHLALDVHHHRRRVQQHDEDARACRSICATRMHGHRLSALPPAGGRASRPAACSGPPGCAPRTRAGSASASSAPASPPRRRTRTASCRRCCAEMLDSRSRSRICPSPRSILLQDLVQPVGALAARRALAARLVAVEVQQVLGQPHHAGRVVEHDRSPAEPSSEPAFCDAVEAGLRVELIGQQNRHRRAAGDDRLQRPAVAHAAGAGRRSARAA